MSTGPHPKYNTITTNTNTQPPGRNLTPPRIHAVTQSQNVVYNPPNNTDSATQQDEWLQQNHCKIFDHHSPYTEVPAEHSCADTNT